MNAIKDNSLSEHHFKESCPEEVVFQNENVSSTNDSLLDVDLEIKDKKISAKSYENRNSFPFEIVCIPINPLKFQRYSA